MKVIIIGGSREAEQLQQRLSDAVIVDGDDLPDSFDADAVIDASHPCEPETPDLVAALCDDQDIPYLRLRRAEWQPLAEDAWLNVADAMEAASILQRDWRRVFLCLGEADRVPFSDDDGRWYLVRTNQRDAASLPPNYALTPKDGPFLVEQEINLMRHHKIDVLVTRNAGGKGAVPKVSAARAIGLPVVMLDRPEAPGPEVAKIGKALSWLGSLARR
jgi:precorrin-6A/cobalt-precorrin-6A reductase